MSRELEEDTVLGSSAAPQPPGRAFLAQAERLGRSGSTPAGSAAGSADSIVVSIGQFELGKTLYHDHKVRQMFMLFEFMPKFHRMTQQQTMRVKKESQDFWYTKASSVKDSGVESRTRGAARRRQPRGRDDPVLPRVGRQRHGFPRCRVFRAEAHGHLQARRLRDRRVEASDRNDAPIGHVAVSMVAQKALQ